MGLDGVSKQIQIDPVNTTLGKALQTSEYVWCLLGHNQIHYFGRIVYRFYKQGRTSSPYLIGTSSMFIDGKFRLTQGAQYNEILGGVDTPITLFAYQDQDQPLRPQPEQG